MGKSPYQVVVVGTGDEAVTVYTVLNPNPTYTAIYRNLDTRGLDKNFVLDGTKIEPKTPRDQALTRAAQLAALGHTNVERLLRYFVDIARIHQVFIGLPEAELRQQIENDVKIERLNKKVHSDYGLKADYIDQAVAHYDLVDAGGIIKPVSYLKRISVKGIDVLFPANLRRV